MCATYLGFILLIWFPGVLHAQSSALLCQAPKLNGGYFIPGQNTYTPGTTITYACDNRHKPLVDGWWEKSTCENGSWVPKPQCIDIKACFPPTIPNGKYTENSNGWYENTHVIRINCDRGYEHKNRVATATCVNGEWSSLPVCQKRLNACIEPPKVPHAVISQEYQEVFPADSEVVYRCEDGYAIEGAQTSKSILCIAGAWGEGPKCNKVTGTTAGHGDSPEVETGGEHTASTGHGRQPATGDKVTGTTAGHGGSPEVETGGEHTASTGHGRQPATGDASCVMTSGRYDNGLELSGNVFIKEGEGKYLRCEWRDYFMAVQCSNGRILHTRCCPRDYFTSGHCQLREARLLV